MDSEESEDSFDFCWTGTALDLDRSIGEKRPLLSCICFESLEGWRAVGLSWDVGSLVSLEMTCLIGSTTLLLRSRSWVFFEPPGAPRRQVVHSCPIIWILCGFEFCGMEKGFLGLWDLEIDGKG